MPPIEFIAQTLLLGALLPAVLALAPLLVLRLRPGAGDVAQRAAGAMALGVGFLAGYAALGGEPLRPAEPQDWLPALALLAGAVGTLEGLPRTPTALGWALRLGVAGLAAWLLLPQWLAAKPTAWQWQLGIGAAILGLWAALDALAARRPGNWFAPLLALTAAVGAAVLMCASTAKFAQAAGVLAATLAGAALAIRGQFLPLRGLVPGVAVLLPGLMAEGAMNTFSDVPLASFALVAAAPLMLVAGGRGWRVATAAVLLPLAAAVGLAVAMTSGGEGEGGTAPEVTSPAP
jgi:hypothetical protein